jgi:hypothetical protein
VQQLVGILCAACSCFLDNPHHSMHAQSILAPQFPVPRPTSFMHILDMFLAPPSPRDRGLWRHVIHQYVFLKIICKVWSPPTRPLLADADCLVGLRLHHTTQWRRYHARSIAGCIPSTCISCCRPSLSLV